METSANRNGKPFRRQSSDILVLDEPSQPPSLSPAPEDTEEASAMENSSPVETSNHAVENSQNDTLSPCGSLTERTVSAMVNHMYRSVYDNQECDGDGIEVIDGAGSVDTSSIGFVVDDDRSSSFRSVEDRFGLGLPKGDTTFGLTVLKEMIFESFVGGKKFGSSDIHAVPVEGAEACVLTR